MNKNAYEIRLELLNLAHGDCQNRFYEKLNLLKEADNRNFDSYLRAVEKDTPDTVRLSFISECTAEKIDALLPSSAEIITRAEELYRFIEGK
jgi:hypothetical protein